MRKEKRKCGIEITAATSLFEMKVADRWDGLGISNPNRRQHFCIVMFHAYHYLTTLTTDWNKRIAFWEYAVFVPVNVFLFGRTSSSRLFYQWNAASACLYSLSRCTFIYVYAALFTYPQYLPLYRFMHRTRESRRPIFSDKFSIFYQRKIPAECSYSFRLYRSTYTWRKATIRDFRILLFVDLNFINLRVRLCIFQSLRDLKGKERNWFRT